MKGWVPQILAQELRKVFAYRVAFWMRFGLGITTELTVAYFLWGAIFEVNGEATIGGYTFGGILYYTVFASLGTRIIRPLDRGGFISEEIYQGGLTRYLLYPVPYLGVSYLAYFAQQIVGVGQLLLGLFLATRVWSPPAELAITPASVALGIATGFLSGAVLFLINAALEMIAFWQDTVWNLMAMLRFIGSLLGGLMIPLSLFPDWGRFVAHLTPFPLVFSFPVRCFLGQVGAEEWVRSALLLGLWGAAMSVVVAAIWRRGIRVYSGVGI